MPGNGTYWTMHLRHPSTQTDPDYCLAESYILADAAIAAVASSIWDREIHGSTSSQDSLCGPHSGLPQFQ